MGKTEIFDWVGRCKPSDLPSSHPYWSFKVKQDLKRDIRRERKKIEKCLKDPDKTKFIYGNLGVDVGFASINLRKRLLRERKERECVIVVSR